MVSKRTVENQKLLNHQFKEYLKNAKLIHYTKKEQADFKRELQEKIIKEIVNLSGKEKIKTRMINQKYNEIRNKMSRYGMDVLEEVKNKIWIPTDKSDYRRIIPEMILISDNIKVSKKDIFGQDCFDTYDYNQKLARDWNILSSCVSLARNDNSPGRNLKYIVQDKISKKYLGVINITSCLPNVSPRNHAVFKTGNIKGKYWYPDSTVTNNMATGQKIVPTQPFGEELLGGKLLSLLCVSKQVQDDWKWKFGDILVSVDTTSLYGGQISKGNETQYDGMRPIWYYLGDTAGKSIPFKVSDVTFNSMVRYLQMVDVKEWFKLKRAKTSEGQNLTRESKNQIIKKVFTLLDIKKHITSLDDNLKIESQEPRGCYLSRLYKNTDEFLRNEIKEEDLVPAFNNSIEFLTELWKFGYFGDTKSYINPDIVLMYERFKNTQEESSNRKDKKSETRTAVKTRIQSQRLRKLRIALEKKGLVEVIKHIDAKLSGVKKKQKNLKKGEKRKEVKPISQKTSLDKSFIEYYIRKYKLQKEVRMNEEVSWYGSMLNLTWDEVKEKFASEFD